jgi:hypothetical protein
MKASSRQPDAMRGTVRRIAAHFIVILLTSAGSALADNSVKLQIAPKSHFSDPKNSHEEVQDRWLEITAMAFHLEKPSQVRLEWIFYGDDLVARKVVKHAEGSGTIELIQGKTASLKTKPARYNFTPRHTVKTGSGKRSRAKTVEATGIRYHAWAVRAFIDGVLVGEAYSLPAIKKLFDGGSQR